MCESAGLFVLLIGEFMAGRMYFRESSPRDRQCSDEEWDRRWDIAFGEKGNYTLTPDYTNSDEPYPIIYEAWIKDLVEYTKKKGGYRNGMTLELPRAICITEDLKKVADELGVKIIQAKSPFNLEM